jgi:DNA polymerase-3 subunit delta
MPGASPDRLLEIFSAGAGKKRKTACVALIGEDEYLREFCRRTLIEANVPESVREWAVVRTSFEDEGLERILAMAQSYPMLSPRQVIFARELEAVEGLEEKARDAAIAQLAAYLEDPAPFTVLVLEATGLDQRMKLAKLLLEKVLVVSVSLAEGADRKVQDAIPVISQMAREAGVSIDADAAAQLADCLDGELAHIAPEVAKLAAYAGAAERITVADVQALVSAAKKYTVWQLAEILGSGDPARALVFLDGLLREGEEPVGLIGAMAWMCRKLIEVQELPPGMNKFAAAGRLRMRPDTVELAMSRARGVPRERLLRGLDALAEADAKLRSGSRAQRAILEFLLAELAAPFSKASRAS